MKQTSLKLREIEIRGQTFWQLEKPKVGGGRIRRTFKDKQKAETAFDLAKIELKNFGTAGVSLPERLRSDAVEADRILKPYGASILDAVRFFVDHRDAQKKSRPVADAVREFIQGLKDDGRSHRYTLDLKNRLEKFAEDFGESKLAEVTTSIVENWLRGLGVGAVTRNSYRRRLYSLFEHGIARGWCQTNPISKVGIARERPQPIGILRPQEFATLLENALDETVPFWAIAGFAGVRTAELVRLEWRDVHFDSKLIEISGDKSKTAQRRFIEIQPALAAWLQPYKGLRGRICPLNLRKLLEADRQRAKLKTWPNNALRHSYASYHLAAFQDSGKLANQLGHASPNIVFRHYRELVQPAIAKEWWQIFPQQSEKIVRLAS